MTDFLNLHSRLHCSSRLCDGTHTNTAARAADTALSAPEKRYRRARIAVLDARICLPGGERLESRVFAARADGPRKRASDDLRRRTTARAAPRRRGSAARERSEAKARPWPAAGREDRVRSDRAGSASRAHRAHKQDAAIPAVRPRRRVPDRRFHRPDRRSDRAQCDAPASDTRGDTARTREPTRRRSSRSSTASGPGSSSTRAGWAR